MTGLPGGRRVTGKAEVQGSELPRARPAQKQERQRQRRAGEHLARSAAGGARAELHWVSRGLLEPGSVSRNTSLEAESGSGVLESQAKLRTGSVLLSDRPCGFKSCSHAVHLTGAAAGGGFCFSFCTREDDRVFTRLEPLLRKRGSPR